ncbi:MAG: hypothetical protein LUE86_03125 [Clostridiales bacterium]|nr:hypothetical protein [Clostridiales bacterium]
MVSQRFSSFTNFSAMMYRHNISSFRKLSLAEEKILCYHNGANTMSLYFFDKGLPGLWAPVFYAEAFLLPHIQAIAWRM